MLNYLDTSIVIAYYCPEPGSEAAERLVRSRAGAAVSDLTEVEVLSAIARKARVGELRAPDAGRAAAEFLAHLDIGVFTRLPVERRHYRLAGEWLAQGAVPLAALDTLHLAIAAAARLPLATADRGMARAAGAVGIEVVGL